MYSHLVVINGSFFEGILPLSHSISRLGCRQNATLMKGATFFTGVRKPVTVPALRFPLSFWLGLDADSGEHLTQQWIQGSHLARGEGG